MVRACCDDIEELAPFRTDPRPTWLFLSSGVPTALLRGANRPLLSKLFLSELQQEREGRLPVFIDYKSPSVIQCVGPLGCLAQDKTVQSIGQSSVLTPRAGYSDKKPFSFLTHKFKKIR